MSWSTEFWSSIKGFDTEEKLDLYFYRPFGFLIAKLAKALKMSPTQLTLIGLALGITSGFYFYQNQSTTSLIVASILLIMAGVFDSSDGQLARMGGRSTKLGLVLDGLCDNLVFASAYSGSILTLMPGWGWIIWPIGLIAGACHSFQSSMLDYYNREYLYFGYAKINGDYWNPTITEARRERASAEGDDKIFWKLRFSWLWQQNKLSNRRDETRFQWKALVTGKESAVFQELYRQHNRFILRAWRLMGPNFHTIMILICVFLRRFDLYLIIVDIITLSIALILLRFLQEHQDRKLVQALKARGLL